MSSDRDVTRIVQSWLEEGVTALPDRVLDTVLDQLPATPQRRPDWLARRFRPMNNSIIRYGVVAAVVVVAVILGINLLGPNVGGDPEPTPTPRAVASPRALPIAAGTALSSGTYSLSSFPVGITVEVPAGWIVCSLNEVEQGVCHFSDTAPEFGVGFLIVDNVVADPCGSGEELLDPPVGPSVDDLVTAISSLEGFAATAPLELTVDGFDGKQFTLTAPENPVAGCELTTWATANRTNGVGPGEINLLRILDVNGTRVVISGAYHPEDPAAAENLSALEQVMASVRIEP